MKYDNPRLPVMAAALLCLCSPNIFAEEIDRLDSLTITVIAEDQESRLPLAVTKVEADELVSPSEQSLQDFLDPAPGLFTQNQDNAAQGLRPSIRGFGSRAAFGVRGIRVVLDGVPMTLPDGQTELDAIDLGLLDSARIIRGPSASLFGNASGGAIILKTRPVPENPEARLDLHTSSFDSRRIRFEGGGHYRDTGLLAAYTDTSYNGFRDHANTDTSLLNARLSQPLGTGKLNAYISALDITAQDPGSLTATQARENRRAARDANVNFNAGETIEQQRVALTWDGMISDWALQYTGYAGQRDFSNRLPFTGGGQVQFDRNFGGLGTTLSREFSGPMFRHGFSAGLDIQIQQDNRTRFDNNNGIRGARTLAQNEEAFSTGLFLRDTIALSPLWETSLGLRYDTLNLKVEDRFLTDGDNSGDRDIDDLSADLSLTRWLDSGMFYIRVASSFETPTFTELANPNGGGFNEQVESSEALNKEIGFKGQWQSVGYSVAIYHIDVDDELLPFELAAQPGRTFYRNAGKTQRMGLELSANTQLSSAWSLISSYTLSENEFDSGELTGKSLPGIPDQQLWMSLNFKQDAYRLAVIGQHIGKLYADDENTEKVSAYELLHLQASVDLGSLFNSPVWQLQLGIDNILDEDYNDNVRINAFGGRYYEPAAGRAYRLAASLRF